MTLSTSSPRATQRWLLLIALTLTLTAIGAAVTLGVHAVDQFELDKNAADSPPGGADDWNNVYQSVILGGDDKCLALGAVECAFVNDGVGSTIFTGGSTKDHLPISGWLHSTGSVPDKTEILNAYAAKYVVDGEQLLYFGADRFAVNGSTDFGFWFFRNPVAANLNGTFSGAHTGTLASPGDFLVLGTFTNGGAATNIRVFQWVGTGGNESGSIQSNATFGDCADLAVNALDAGCATVNNALIPVAWPYAPKSGPSGSVPSGGLLEGGINLTDLGLSGCFSSFVAETRSSPSITAVLKDFVVGNFETCGSALTTTPSDGNGTAIPAGGASITTAGSIQVRDGASLVVNGIDTWSGTMHFWLCKLDAGVCDGTVNVGTEILPAVAVNQDTDPILSSSATITSAGRYCWRGFFDSNTNGLPDAQDSDLARECFTVNAVQPTLTTNATAAVKLGDPISDTATLTGTANKPGTPIINPTTPGGAAGGSITFKLYGPNDATCSTTPVFTSQAIAVSGDGTSYGSGNFTPTAVGAYRWVAAYTGNLPNTLAAAGACGDSNETSVVVDANIELNPLTATNEVGDQHTITATVKQNVGAGFVAAPNGTLVTFSLLENDANASFTGSPPVSTCLTVAGACSVSINTDTPGSVDINATTTFDVMGVSVTRSTGTTGNSDDANKLYVDAQIDLDPLEATNEVTSPHTITATVKQNVGAGFVNAPNGTLVTFSLLSNTAGATFTGSPAVSTCLTASGTCSVSINTSTAGSVDIHATTTFDIAGESVTRATDTGGNNSDDANKLYVDAQIDLTPLTATNNISEDHVITATVLQDDGLAASDGGDGVTGFGPAPNGTVVRFNLLLNTAGAIFVADLVDSDPDSIPGNDCVVAGGAGQCSVTINSSTAGSVDIHASVMFSIQGESVTRATGTGGANSADANKIYVDGTLYWLKHDQDGALLPGATFQVCRTHNLDTSGATPQQVEITPDPICETVTDESDDDSVDGSFRLDNVVLGTYEIVETIAPTGYEFDENDVYTVVLDLVNRNNQAASDDAGNVFVNTRLFKLIVFACNQVTGELVQSTVDIDGNVKDTITDVPAGLVGVTEEMLCGITEGATYQNLAAGVYEASVTIPKGFVIE